MPLDEPYIFNPDYKVEVWSLFEMQKFQHWLLPHVFVKLNLILYNL